MKSGNSMFWCQIPVLAILLLSLLYLVLYLCRGFSPGGVTGSKNLEFLSFTRCIFFFLEEIQISSVIRLSNSFKKGLFLLSHADNMLMLVTWLGCVALPMTPVRYFGKDIKTSINWPWRRACSVSVCCKHLRQGSTNLYRTLLSLKT